MGNTSNSFLLKSARAVRLVLDHEHPYRLAVIMPMSAKIGYTGQTLNEWEKKAEVDACKRAGVPAERMKALKRENRELRHANEIKRKTSAHFAQAEFDRPLRK